MVSVRVLISVKCNYMYMYFITSLRGKNEVEENKFIDITHWDVSAVVLVLMMFRKWYRSKY